MQLLKDAHQFFFIFLVIWFDIWFDCYCCRCWILQYTHRSMFVVWKRLIESFVLFWFQCVSFTEPMVGMQGKVIFFTEKKNTLSESKTNSFLGQNRKEMNEWEKDSEWMVCSMFFDFTYLHKYLSSSISLIGCQMMYTITNCMYNLYGPFHSTVPLLLLLLLPF